MGGPEPERAQSRAQAHVDALRHDLDARDRVRVVARGRRDVVVEEVPDRRVPAKVNLLWRTRRRRRRRDALAVLLAVVDLDSVALQLCPRDCRAKVAALRDERRREKLPDGGHAADGGLAPSIACEPQGAGCGRVRGEGVLRSTPLPRGRERRRPSAIFAADLPRTLLPGGKPRPVV